MITDPEQDWTQDSNTAKQMKKQDTADKTNETHLNWTNNEVTIETNRQGVEAD